MNHFDRYHRGILLLIAGLILCLTATVSAQALRQTKSTFKSLTHSDETPGNALKQLAGGSGEVEYRPIAKEKDKWGKTHESFQMYFKKLRVENGIVKIHSERGKVYAITGNLQRPELSAVRPTIGEDAALNGVLQKNRSYIWKKTSEEAYLKENLNDPTASYLPSGELVVVDVSPSEKSDFRLAYKFDIYSVAPLERFFVYVDATTGSVLKKVSRIQDGASNGVGDTRYSGTQLFKTDSTGPNAYRLRDYSRGNGVITYNLNHTTDDANAVDLTDADNHWTAGEYHGNSDDGALDAHWGMQVVYDYLHDVHNQNSWDGNNSPMLGYVHYNSNYPNAFWDGLSVHFGQFGSNPWTELDVVGHEFGHGIMQALASLDYSAESASVHEGCADIWGAFVDIYANEHRGQSRNPWVFSELIAYSRAFQQPATYRSIDWDFTNQSPHGNGQVARYWLYLLSQGGSGTNRFGEQYNITPIGVHNAEAIFYQAFKYYVTPTAYFPDLRAATVLAAQDVNPSFVETIKAAWNAVGVAALESPIECTGGAQLANSLWINNLKVGTVTGSGSGWGTGGYTHSDQKFDLVLGKKTRVEVFYSAAITKNYAIWIDYNQNGIFEEPAERVASGTTGAYSSVDSIQLPLTLTGPSPYGRTTLRVAVSTDAIATACDNLASGEIEDFDIAFDPQQVINGYKIPSGADANEELLGPIKLGPLELPILFYPSLGYKSAPNQLTGYALFAYAGESYPLKMKAKMLGNTTYDEYYSVWIDFDSNRTFSPSELVFTAHSPDSVAGRIQIPQSVASCTTMARIIMSRGAYVLDPNSAPEFGECTDFFVVLRQNPNTPDGYHAPRGNGWFSYITEPEYFYIDSIQSGNTGYLFNRFPDENGYVDLKGTFDVVFNSGQTNGNIRLTAFRDPNLAPSDSVYWNAWIDLNGDKDFNDANEHVYYNYGKQQTTGSITIPAVPSLNTRMRFSVSYFANHPHPDSLIPYGQVMDVGFKVLPPFDRSAALVNPVLAEDFESTRLATLRSSLTGNTAGLSFTALKLGNGINVTLSNDTIYATSVKDFNGSVKVAATTTNGTYTLYDTITVTVTPVNDAPVVTNLMRDTTLNQGFTKTLIEIVTDNFFDVDNVNLTYSVVSSSAAIGAVISHDSLYVHTISAAAGPIPIIVTASDGALSVKDTLILTVLDNVPPVGYVYGLAVNFLPRIRFSVGGNEALSAASLTVNGTPVTLTKRNSSRYSGQYDLPSVPANLSVSVNVTDVSGNAGAQVNRSLIISNLSKPLTLGRITVAKSGGVASSGNLVILSDERPEESVIPAGSVVVFSVHTEEALAFSMPAVSEGMGGYKLYWSAQPNENDEEGIHWIDVPAVRQHGEIRATLDKSGFYALVAVSSAEDVPDRFALLGNYPNPFNPTTTIRYDLAEHESVSLTVYNLLGQRIRELVSQNQEAGHYTIVWDGRNDNGAQVSSGIYVYRLTAGSRVFSRKMTLLK